MLRGKVTLLLMMLGLLLAVPAIALADNLQDSITAGSNAKTIATGAANGFTNNYWVLNTQSNGCDIPAGGNVKFKLNVPAEVTASTTDLTFTSCGTSTTNTQPVTFSSDNPGVYDISASYVSETDSAGVTTTDPASDTYNENDAKLTLTVVGVDSVTPTDGATGVAANTDVTATFVTNTSGTTGPFDTSTFKLEKDGTTTSVPAAISYNSTTKVATLNPNSDLELGTKYNATISGVSSGGVALETKTWSFTTVAPACTIPADPTFSGTPDGSNGWYKTIPTVSASSTAGATVQYSLDAAGPFSNTAPTLGQGETTVYAKAVSGTCSSGVSSQLYKVDTAAPVISQDEVKSGTLGLNGWYTTDVGYGFTASDPNGTNASGLATADQAFTKNITTEGPAQNVSSGTVTDLAGNVATAINSSNFKIDKSDPYNIQFVGGPAAGNSYDFGNVPAAPTCTADDAVSGLKDCVVTGYSSAVGNHTLTATATDNAGRTKTETRSYTVKAWTLSGFYNPVDYDTTTTTVWNTVKGGSTVPLKFEVFNSLGELTDISVVDKFTATPVTCPNGTLTTDAIEILSTGGTTLRYDGTGGQFIQNWQTPKKPGACYNVTMTTDDGSTLPVAHFQLK